MTHFLIRIGVWAVILGGAYLVFGPQLFDSSRGDNPFSSATEIFLPPAKSEREIALEALLVESELEPAEAEEYRSLVSQRRSGFWQGEGVSVAQALSGVSRGRKQRLAEILAQRGVSPDDAAVFLMVVERDQPELLADRD